MPPRVFHTPETPATRAADAAMNAVIAVLGEEWLVEHEALMILIIDAKGDLDEETCCAACRKFDGNPALVTDVIPALMAHSAAALRAVGKDMKVITLGEG